MFLVVVEQVRGSNRCIASKKVHGDSPPGTNKLYTRQLYSYVDDTRVSRSIVDQGADFQALQDDLATIYSWAEDVNMTFNSEKFECIRYWPRNNKPDFIYKSPDGSVIEEKDHLRDLGVEMASDLTYSIHISNTVTAANWLVGWALRSFWRRSRLVMLTL